MIIRPDELMEAPAWGSRAELPRILNELGLLGHGLEVGVQRGINASHIRAGWNGVMFHGVDIWRPYYGVRDLQEHHTRYKEDAYMHLGNVGKAFALHQMTAMEFAAKAATDGMRFSFVYLDGDHDEEPLRKEIEAFWPLVESGGILAGHDYQPNGWIRDEQPTIAFASAEEAGEGQHCGPFFVKRVVDETFPAGFVSITSPDTDRGWRSWLVRKR